jgi:hypothetical protein
VFSERSDLSVEASAHLQKHCGLYPRDREIPAGRVIPGRPGDPLFKIFIKIEISLENIIPENIDTSFPRSMICATVFIIVTVLNFCLTNKRKINRSATFCFNKFYKVTIYRRIM